MARLIASSSPSCTVGPRATSSGRGAVLRMARVSQMHGPPSRAGKLQVKALLTPPPETGEKKKKFITRDEEPDEYWASKGERDGANVFVDPIAIVGIIAILFPFIFLLFAIATGAVDISVYK